MKKQRALNASLVVACVVGSVIGGWYLACIFGTLPFEMPTFIDAFIRQALSVTGNDELANPDDMEVLAFLLYWTIATLLIALALFGSKRWLFRCLVARKNGEAIPKLPLFVTLDTCLLALLVSADLGWCLSSLFTGYLYEIPVPIRAVFRFYQSINSQPSGSSLYDDVGFFALNLYWAIAALLVGVLLVMCCIAVRRFMHRKTP